MSNPSVTVMLKPVAPQIAACVLATLMFAGTASAQQRPLVTEDPETIGAGRVLLEGGFEIGWDQFFPLSGFKGDLLRVPTLGTSIGISSIAELQIDGAVLDRLKITEKQPGPLSHLDLGDRSTTVEDLMVGAKIRLVPEGTSRPALGARFATKVPLAGAASGIASGNVDFYVSALLGKTVQSVRVVGNVGVGWVGDATAGPLTHSMFIYGVSVARAIYTGFEVVGEFNGRTNTERGAPRVGGENRGVMRLGARYTHSAIRFDAAILAGMTSRDPGFGVTAGLTYVFNAFRVP